MTYITLFSDFALYLEGYLVDEHHTFGQCVDKRHKDDPIINLGHSDIFHGPVILCHVLLEYQTMG